MADPVSLAWEQMRESYCPKSPQSSPTTEQLLLTYFLIATNSRVTSDRIELSNSIPIFCNIQKYPVGF